MRFRFILPAFFILGGLMATGTAEAQGAGCGAVKREMAYGEAAIQHAKSRADYLDAAKQYRAAIKKAPSCAAAHFNLGVAYEKAGRLSSAKAAYERYLKLAPQAKDAAKVEKSIFKLEYLIKMAGQKRRAAKARAGNVPKPPAPKRKIFNLTGEWVGIDSPRGRIHSAYCNRGEYFRMVTSGASFTMKQLKSNLVPLINLKGRIKGSAISGIVTFDWRALLGPYLKIVEKPFVGSIGANGRRIVVIFDFMHVQASPPSTSRLTCAYGRHN